jgi:hypothetical protein
MLLLLRSPPTGLAAASLGITLGLTATGSGTSATLGITLGLTPPESIEMQLTGVCGITFGLSGVPIGFQAGAATPGIVMGLAARGGFGGSPTIPINLGLSGTVGSFFDGIGTVTITHGLTAFPVIVAGASLGITLGLSGAPIISGGTISGAANLATNLDLTNTSHALGTSGLLALTLGLRGSAFAETASTVESMALTFESDSVRTFFRKR